MPVSAITSNFGVVNIEIISIAKIKAHFDQFIAAAQRGPVVITEKNRPVVVSLSMDDIQDTIWAKKAWEVHEEGYLKAEESAARLNALLNAGD